MRLCSDVITVFNRALTPDKRKIYLPTVLSGVHWFGTEKVTVTSDGLISAKQYTLRIPIQVDTHGKYYLQPKEYHKSSDKSRFFTLDEGDIIVKGAVSAGPDVTPSYLQDNYNDVTTVVSVTDNRSAPNAKHWKVVGK